MTANLAIIRDAAISTLVAQATLAGGNVNRSRVDPVQEGTMPVINVYGGHVRMVSVSDGLAAPTYDVTGTLTLQLLVERGALADCQTDLDTLQQQVLDALLEDPIWVPTAKPDGQGSTIEATQSLKGDAQRVLGECIITMPIGPWRETYPARTPTQLVIVTVTTDAADIYSPSGSFTDDATAGFPNAALPAPRTSGPDGRAEVPTVTITLPTD